MQHGLALLLSLVLGLGSIVAAGQTAPPSASERHFLGLRGVYFVENSGQWSDESVHYGLKSRGLDVAFRDSSFTMHLSRDCSERSEPGRAAPTNTLNELNAPNALNAPSNSSDRVRSGSLGSLENLQYEYLTLTVSFPGSNPVTPRGAQPQAAKFNYFVGGEGRNTASNVPSFAAVIYENIYDGIDLHVMGNDDGVMKYEFHCAPGADYTQIRIHYDGIDSLCINEDGDLEIVTSFGTLRDGAPLVWQEDAGAQHDAPAPRAGPCRPDEPTIPARFELIDEHTYRIALDSEVDPTRELIIDPEIEWMTYLGGSGGDVGVGIAVDAAGNALVAGDTTSSDFTGRNNSHHGGVYDRDAFALKVSPSGQVQWMTYLGGSDRDLGRGIAVDAAGNALVAGDTTSSDFTGRNNSHYGGTTDAFALKVSPTGQLQWMTYLGGSDGDSGYGIAVDGAGDALMTGYTFSTDFAGRNNSHYGGGFDAFALNVSPSGQVQWMTYLGGSGKYGIAEDVGSGIAVDGAGNALVSGYTHSTDFAGRNNSHHGGYYDAFALKVSPSGQLQWMTYLGGRGNDGNQGYFDNPGIAVDGAGNALVTGVTSSLDFAGRNNSHYGYWDAFALKVSPSGQLQWMTYLGGSEDDFGFGIALDSAGNALVTGETYSTDFAGRNNSNHGDWDAFIVKLRLADGPQLTVAATCPSGGLIRIEWSGATPGGQIALIFARNTGSFIVPNNYPCAGTQLGLGSNQIQLAFQGGAGSNGSRILNANAGPNACGGHLQLLDLSTCGTSNVARVE